MNKTQIKKLNSKLLRHSFQHPNSISLGMPNQLFIEPTNFCNASCPLCPVGVHELGRKQGYMKMDTFDHILNGFGPFLQDIYLWNYGEPFLHPEILEMIRKSHQMQIRTTISTNGTGLYDQQNIQKILSSGLDVLIISLDGATSEIFNQYRIGVDFERVLNGFEYLVAEKKRRGIFTPEIEIQFLVMKQNYAQIPLVQELARRFGVNLTFKCVNIDFLGRNLETGDNYLPEGEAYNRYRRGSNTYLPRFHREQVCYQLWHSLVINWDGTVVPCCKDYNNTYPIGNVLTNSPASIWNGKTMRSLRTTFLKTPDSIPLCADCFLTDFSLIKVRNNVICN